MNTVAKKLRYLIEKKGVTQHEVCTELGLKESAFSLWLSGKRNPKASSTKKLANYFGVSYSYLIDDEEEYVVKMPILSNINGSIPIDAISDINEYEDISIAMSKTGEFFGIINKGKSMEPFIHDGDTIIARRQTSIKSGEVAVVYMDDYRALCKIVIDLPDGGICLVGYNESVYSPKNFTVEELKEQNYKVLGKVIKSVHNFD